MTGLHDTIRVSVGSPAAWNPFFIPLGSPTGGHRPTGLHDTIMVYQSDPGCVESIFHPFRVTRWRSPTAGPQIPGCVGDVGVDHGGGYDDDGGDDGTFHHQRLFHRDSQPHCDSQCSRDRCHGDCHDSQGSSCCLPLPLRAAGAVDEAAGAAEPLPPGPFM